MKINQNFDLLYLEYTENLFSSISSLCNSDYSISRMETPVMGGRNRDRLKDSLDVVGGLKPNNKPHSPQRKLRKSEEDITVTSNNQELIRNTMRNSRILSEEEMQKLKDINKNSPKTPKANNQFVTTIHKNVEGLAGVNVKKNFASSNNLPKNFGSKRSCCCRFCKS